MYLYCMYFAMNRSDDDGCFPPVYEINVSDMRTQSKHSMTTFSDKPQTAPIIEILQGNVCGLLAGWRKRFNSSQTGLLSDSEVI